MEYSELKRIKEDLDKGVEPIVDWGKAKEELDELFDNCVINESLSLPDKICKLCGRPL